jgi:hypothetical protein
MDIWLVLPGFQFERALNVASVLCIRLLRACDCGSKSLTA